MRITKAGPLIAAALLTINAGTGAPTNPKDVYSIASVTFSARSGASPGPFCRGVRIGEHILTARHCIALAKASVDHGERPEVIGLGNLHVDLDEEILGPLTSRSPAAAGGSIGLDFAVINLPRALADSIQPLELTTPVELDDRVILSHDLGHASECVVTSICGGEIQYHCRGGAPQNRWSGSGVWKVIGGSAKLVAIHHDGGSNTDPWGAATSFVDVLGRSRQMFKDPDLLATAFARNPAYSYIWKTKGQPCPRTSTARRFSVDPLARPFGQPGAATVDASHVLIVDTFLARACVFNVVTRKPAFCVINPSPFQGRINGSVALGGGMFALLEAAPSGKPEGGVSYLSVDMVKRIISYDPPGWPRMITDAKGTISALRAGDDIFFGGREGWGRRRDTSAIPVCTDNPECKNRWRVNGMVAVDDNTVVGVGADYDVNSSPVPTCVWLRRQGVTWTWNGYCDRSGVLKDGATALSASGRPFQLKAPIVLDGDVLAFGSDGRAYRLFPDRSVKRLAIEGLDARENQEIEDSIRVAQKLDEHHALIGSSDGSVRLLTYIRTPNGSALRASETWTVYDVSLWVTGLAAGPGWAIAKGQDGSLTLLKWLGDFPSPN